MKRTLVMLMAMLMVLTLMVGCASEPAAITEPAETPSTTTDATTAETPADTTEEPIDEPAEDTTTEVPVEEPAEEPTVELPQPGPVELPIASELTTYSMWIPNFMDSAMPQNDPNEFPVWQEMERRTNIHIEWTLGTSSNAAEQFSLMLTAEDYTDLFAGALNNLVGGVDYSIEEEIIIDLAEMVPQYMPNYYALITADEYTRKCCYTDTGKLGALRVAQDSAEPPFYGWVARQDMLDAIAFEGTMETISDWDTVLAGLKEAGLGKLYLGTTTGQQDLIMQAYGVSTTFLQKDGQVFYGPVEDGYREYLAKIVEWNEAGYIDPDFAGRTSGWYQDFSLLISGEMFVMPTIYTMYDLIAMMGASNPDMKLIAVDVPKLNEGDSLFVKNFGGPTRQHLGGSSVCVSTACEDVPTILKWFDYFCTEEGYMLGNYGIEGESYNLVEGEVVYTDLILNNPDGFTKSQMQGLYSINSYITQYYDFNRAGGGLSEDAIACTALWCSDYDFDKAYDLPTDGIMTMTTEESEDLGSRVSDIQTYVQEYSALVVTGQKDLDSTWDEYVANIEAMNLQECIDTYQAAYDRFLAR